MYAKKQFVNAASVCLLVVLASSWLAAAHGQETGPGDPISTDASDPAADEKTSETASDAAAQPAGAASSDSGDSGDAGVTGAPASDASPPRLSAAISSEGPPTLHGGSRPEDEPSLIDEDVAPSIKVFQSDRAEVRLGGLVQVHFTPFVGEDSLPSNDDPAASEGFRLRRARVGVEGLFDELRLLLVINPLETDNEVGTVSDARITLQTPLGPSVSLGSTKVPFSRAGLESSRSLMAIERPLSVRTMTPERRLGITVEGDLLGQKLGYLAGFMNATEGFDPGNAYGGFLYALRVQFAVLGQPNTRRPEQLGLAVGVGGLFEDGPATTRMAGAADILLTVARASVKFEFLYDKQEPTDAPVPSPELPDEVERLGGFVEFGYTLPRWSLQPVVRVELFDDYRSVDDAGDVLLFSAGVNAQVHANTRLQLHYLGRAERNGEERSNDQVVLNVQGEF